MGSHYSKRIDYNKIKDITSLKKEEFEYLRKKFYKACEKDEETLNKEQFKKLYTSLRNEPLHNLNSITDFIFKAFDINSDGF